jgi:hypothetical protein
MQLSFAAFALFFAASALSRRLPSGSLEVEDLPQNLADPVHALLHR